MSTVHYRSLVSPPQTSKVSFLQLNIWWHRKY